MRVVVKVGTSSITDEGGHIDEDAVGKLCAELAKARGAGHHVLLVSSGAVAAGLPALGLSDRPRDTLTLQALSAVGQSRLMQVYNEVLGGHGLVAGQVLVSPLDFFERSQYLHARATILRLLELGVLPVVNENDALADAEIRFGDNDRIAALLAHLVRADLLVLLTDTPGVYTADPRIRADASLIEEIQEVDRALETVAGMPGSARGSGGMASKLAAAKIAAWSGVPTIIAASGREAVLLDAISGAPGVGTVIQPRGQHLSARKLWIAFAVPASGTVVVDAGARRALEERGTSLLPVGVTEVAGDFTAGDAVEVAGPDGVVFAKGLTRMAAYQVAGARGKRSEALVGLPGEVVHRDELVLVP
ncbi:MAG: glutamate 5-kinase [Acidimicrobiia bacterium]|nr:glutamate 5-kinase [Acidimicrobiia bacterium]